MPTLTEDFMNPTYFHALTTSIIHGLKVLLVVGSVGAAFTFLTGGTQPKKWPQSDH